MVTTLKRALPAVAALAVLAFAPAAFASTVTSGNPLTLNGQSDVSQDWSFSDSAGSGTVDGYFDGDPVVYDDTNPLPTNCTDYDSGATDTSTPGADSTNAPADPPGDGTAHILRCTAVTAVVATAGDVGSTLDARGLDNTPVTFTGGAGEDSSYGSAQNDVINGGDGGDWVRGQVGDDIVNGGAGDDHVVAGGPGVDTLSGGAGDDYLKGGPDADTIDAGAGNDTVYGDCAGDCSAPDAANDTISGGDGHDYLEGEDGNDTIDAGAGDDYADGGSGNDVIHGGAGDDGLSNDCCFSQGLYGGDGDDQIFGDDGNDSADGGYGNDVIHGGAGDDGRQFSVDFLVVSGQGAFSSQDGLSGGDGDDYVYGDDGIDVLRGDYGSDYIDGGGQSDYIFEYDDEDSATAGNDTVIGGDGVDSVQYSECWSGDEASASFTLDGQANDGLTTTDATYPDDASNNYNVENVDVYDQFVFFPIYFCQGTAPVTLTGDGGANVLSGGHGNDNIDGGAGPDRLEGDVGDDTFQARDGYPDYVSCGDGTDTVTADQFDTLEACENVDVAQVRSAYDKDETPPAPVVFPLAVAPADHIGPKTNLTTDTSITTDQLLKGVNLTVGCDEACTIEGRLLGNQLVGKQASTSAARGFNVILGRKYMGLGSSKRKVTIKPCVRKSKKDAAACRTRLKNQWKNKRSFTVKVQVTTRDKAANRTRTTKLIKVINNHHAKAAR